MTERNVCISERKIGRCEVVTDKVMEDMLHTWMTNVHWRKNRDKHAWCKWVMKGFYVTTSIMMFIMSNSFVKLLIKACLSKVCDSWKITAINKCNHLWTCKRLSFSCCPCILVCLWLLQQWLKENILMLSVKKHVLIIV